MLEWKNWCRLCGSFEVNEKIDPEIENIVEQILETFQVHTTNAIICLDCNEYIRDFQTFVMKSRLISGMFEELQLKEATGELNDALVLQLRQIYNLSLPEIQVFETVQLQYDEVMDEDLNEVESFNMQDDCEAEYLIEDEQIHEVTAEISTHDIMEDASVLEEDIVELESEDNFIFAEIADNSDIEEYDNEAEEESEDLAQYFEFKCHLCDFECKKMYFLTTHTKTEHECLPRVACHCGRFIGSSKVLVNHFEQHVKNILKFHCESCKKWYKTQTHYENHIQSRHSDGEDGRKFQCKCGKSFKEARHLAVHENSHLPDDLKFIHVCKYCDKRYSSIFSLRHHVKHIHIRNPTFNCPSCEKSFSRKANLDSHVNHVHNTERNFECIICGLRVKTKGILRMHKKIHSTNPEDMLGCTMCERSFKTKNQLTNHMVCHSNDKKYKCHLCTAEYKRSKELSNHIGSAHTELPKYPCQWCEKTFSNNSNYRKHKMKMHRSELPELGIKAEVETFMQDTE